MYPEVRVLEAFRDMGFLGSTLKTPNNEIYKITRFRKKSSVKFVPADDFLGNRIGTGLLTKTDMYT